jgi:GH15 family glucan-1,4-alpha-glucosidase
MHPIAGTAQAKMFYGDGIYGEKRHKQRQLSGAAGYRGSAPVRIGNRAHKQFQIGSFGFLADCVWLYLEHGGNWRQDYWTLVCRAAEYVLKHWQEADNGIWELAEKRHFVSAQAQRKPPRLYEL